MDGHFAEFSPVTDIRPDRSLRIQRCVHPDVDRAKESPMLAEVFGVDGIIVLIVVVVLLFGGAAIPKLARNLGSAKNEFEKGLDDGKKASKAADVAAPTVVITAPTAPVASPAPESVSPTS
jgi:TatA/E family protein of Tat protein translocase